MNTTRVMSAIRTISGCEAALVWFAEYGGRASVHVRMDFASSCPGAMAAEKIVSDRIESDIQSIIASAVEDCRKTIEICRQTIIEELGKDQ